MTKFEAPFEKSQGEAKATAAVQTSSTIDNSSDMPAEIPSKWLMGLIEVTTKSNIFLRNGDTVDEGQALDEFLHYYASRCALCLGAVNIEISYAQSDYDQTDPVLPPKIFYFCGGDKKDNMGRETREAPSKKYTLEIKKKSSAVSGLTFKLATNSPSLVLARANLDIFATAALDLLSVVVFRYERTRLESVSLNHHASTDRISTNSLARLEHSEKLAFYGQLAAGMVHELSNPLTAILAAVERLMDSQWMQHAPSEEKARFHYIKDSTSRILGLTQDLMAYARPSVGKKVWVSLHTIFDRALGLCEHELLARKAQVIKLYASSVPDVYVRQEAILQVFVNLISNAAYALPDRAGTIKVMTSIQQDQVLASVEDNGQGIPRELFERIFEPFFSTKENGIGTGLGLSIAKRIVENHAGKLWLESLCDENGASFTRFTVSLPIF